MFIFCVVVCAVSMVLEDQLPYDSILVERQPRVQASHRILHLQTRM